jgi:hypothetical protein
MRAVVVYESMYHNTHTIADAIADGLRESLDVAVVPVDGADAALESGADLLVVGGPTHAHGMSRVGTRKAAVAAAEKPGSDLSVDPGAEGPGVRDWLDRVGQLALEAAAFDTRLDARPWLTGSASKGIARRLRLIGCSLLTEPESFLVTKESELEPDEAARARRWGTSLASLLASPTRASDPG